MKVGILADWLELDPGLWQVESIPRIGSAEEPEAVPSRRFWKRS
jgi:hypothetical protein